MILKNTPQTITGTWADIGSPINTTNYSFINFFVDIDINDSKNVQFRILGKTDDTSDYYDFSELSASTSKIIADMFPIEIGTDADQKSQLLFDIFHSVNSIKLQVRALTVGATSGIINSVYYTKGYRQ